MAGFSSDHTCWCRSPARQQRASKTPFPIVTRYQCPLLPPYPIRWDYFLPSVIRHQWLEGHLLSALRFLIVTLSISWANSGPFQASPASFAALLGFSPGLTNLKTFTEILSSNSGTQWPGTRRAYATVHTRKRGLKNSASTRAAPELLRGDSQRHRGINK